MSRASRAASRLIALTVFASLEPAPQPLSAQTPAADAVDGLVAQGNDAIAARRFRVAASLFERATTARPDHAAFYGFGRAYWGPDRPYPISAPRAIEAFTKARTLAAGKDMALETAVLEALALAQLGRYQ